MNKHAAIRRLNLAQKERGVQRKKESLAEATLTKQKIEDTLASLEADLGHFKTMMLLEGTDPLYDALPSAEGPLRTFYATFGAGYRQGNYTEDGQVANKHSIYPDYVTGLGWLQVEAPSHAHASALMWVVFGKEFSSVYDHDPNEKAIDWSKNYAQWPLGPYPLRSFGLLSWSGSLEFYVLDSWGNTLRTVKVA
jgi:hypothetical protein